ncbi:Hypothetical predicted protein [Octopus vulgaris]|uniref:Uncharacterized protein n=1 Tax=Octopus vulgaris TaxID=6645 RepID=A0AA36FJM6_OCTVU|nr:Hypothetical predicted protein [Octopus vulgaris]
MLKKEEKEQEIPTVATEFTKLITVDDSSKYNVYKMLNCRSRGNNWSYTILWIFISAVVDVVHMLGSNRLIDLKR